MNARQWQSFGQIISRTKNADKIIALTFDDGPTTNTNEIINILNNYNIKATFYVTGQGLLDNPNFGKLINDNGHELGNHSFSHQRMIFKTPEFIKQEILKTDELIKQTGYLGPITFRPPYGKKLFILPWLLSSLNKTTVMWNLEPDSYKDIANEPNKIADYVTKNISPGSIILLHPMYNKADLEALPIIIKQLQDKGYKFLTISQLLQY